METRIRRRGGGQGEKYSVERGGAEGKFEFRGETGRSEAKETSGDTSSRRRQGEKSELQPKKTRDSGGAGREREREKRQRQEWKREKDGRRKEEQSNTWPVRIRIANPSHVSRGTRNHEFSDCCVIRRWFMTNKRIRPGYARFERGITRRVPIMNTYKEEGKEPRWTRPGVGGSPRSVRAVDLFEM